MDTSAYDWTAGFGRISLSVDGAPSIGNARACYGTLRAATGAGVGAPLANDPTLAMRMVPIANGGWLLCAADGKCAGYDADSDTVTFVTPTAAALNSEGAPVAWLLRAWPPVPASLGALALWLDGSDSASMSTALDGTITGWRDTRDGSAGSPRSTTALAKAPGLGGLACPAHFSGGSALTQTHSWDWAVPTTLTVVVSQTGGGTVLSSASTSGDARTLSVPAEAGQATMTAAFETLSTPPLVQPRSLTPVVITATRASPTHWEVYVDGALSVRGPLALPYSSGDQTLTIGDTFDGCMHEFALHARALTADEVASLASYMTFKWGGAPAASDAPPPPPPLPPLGEGAPVELSSWDIAYGTSAAVPTLLGGDADGARCIVGYGELDFNGTALAAPGTYTMAFQVATIA